MHARRSMTTYPNFSYTRILVDGPPTRERIPGSLLVLLTYAYLGEYGLNVCTYNTRTLQREGDLDKVIEQADQIK